ncbi:MAG: hypothetical protein IT323_02125 [Anaerolineae bacterium]|nr:hypothetical protein [Anaerolineae bacterium]
MGDDGWARMEVDPGVAIIIETAGGDLAVVPGNDGEISVEGEGPRIDRVGDGQTIVIHCAGDADVRVPPSARSLHIHSVGGDLKVREFNGPVTVEECGGDAAIREIKGPVSIESAGTDVRVTDITGPLAVGSVSADLTVRDITGPVQVDSVGADMEIKRVMGPANVNSVGADATLRDINGPLNIESVGADLVVTGLNASPFTIESVGSDLLLEIEGSGMLLGQVGHVGGSVSIKVPADASLRCGIPADVERTVNLGGAQVVEQDGRVSVCLGDASPQTPGIEFEAIAGDFQLNGGGRGFGARFEFEANLPDNLDEIISTRITEQLARIQDNLSRQTERIQREAERMAERAREKAERAAERARSRAERAHEQMERHTERLRRGPRGKGWVWSWGGDAPTPPEPPRPPRPPAAPRPPEPVTDQERLAILRMVENKTITIEEAERLLAALEGRS